MQIVSHFCDTAMWYSGITILWSSHANLPCLVDIQPLIMRDLNLWPSCAKLPSSSCMWFDVRKKKHLWILSINILLTILLTAIYRGVDPTFTSILMWAKRCCKIWVKNYIQDCSEKMNPRSLWFEFPTIVWPLIWCLTFHNLLLHIKQVPLFSSSSKRAHPKV